jgi:serine/threonine protein kinase
VFRFDTAAGDDRRRVDAEIRTLAALRHPGLVTVFDAGTVDEPNGEGTRFLVMELVTGPTLGRRPMPAACLVWLAA